MSPRSLSATLACILAFQAIMPVPAAQRGKEPLVERVREAIQRGIDFLRRQEDGKGSWETSDRESFAFRGGYTSLVLLALLNSGVKPDDPAIERGLAFLREVEPKQTYVVSLQTMVFAEAGRKEDKMRIQRNVDWLVASRVMDGTNLRGWTYGDEGRVPDNSNTQYALLGLHAGRQAGAKIDRAVWQSIQDYYIRTQHRDGSWPYSQNNYRLTMTTAGLCGLFISGMELNAGRETLQPDGSARNCGVYAENRPVAQAQAWIGERFRLDLPSAVYYNLYGIERAGRLSGQRFLGNHDWYRRGCEFLVERQREEGSWQQNTFHDDKPIISTTFALLFLSKGRMPVLISKLVHGPGEDWNNDRHDARNLVEYASRELFRGQPLAWQIFDARRVEAHNPDEFNDKLLEPLLQSPIAYFNGHEAPRFTDIEKNLLKQYIEQGGFILAEACCGRPEFDRGFRELMKELFPDSPLKPLAPEHPIWQAHALVPPRELHGIELGCKTVVVYSPRDLSCLWESNQFQSGPGQLAFRLGGNIIAYATGMEPPRPRLTQAVVIRGEAEGKKVPRGYLRVAQLRHEGDWQPAPRAMHNLMAHLRDRAGLDVALQTEALRPSYADLVDFKFLYMHGRSGFTYTADELKNLRANLETGGLLFADACCGKAAFDTAFRAFVGKLFPDKKLELIPPTDELYGREINGTALTTVRCRTPSAGGQPSAFREMAPHLEGIKLDNRWVVIYSKYDIGCALERHQSTDCLGHDPASALQLGSAVVLYALKR